MCRVCVCVQVAHEGAEGSTAAATPVTTIFDAFVSFDDMNLREELLRGIYGAIV